MKEINLCGKARCCPCLKINNDLTYCIVDGPVILSEGRF